MEKILFFLFAWVHSVFSIKLTRQEMAVPCFVTSYNLVEIQTLGETYCLHFTRDRKIAKYNYWLRHFYLFARPYVCPYFCPVFLSVCPYETTRSPLDEFSWNMWFEYFFLKSIEKIRVSLKSNRNNGYFTWRFMNVYDLSLNSLQSEKCFRQTLYRKSKHILCYKICFLITSVLWIMGKIRYSQTGRT